MIVVRYFENEDGENIEIFGLIGDSVCIYRDIPLIEDVVSNGDFEYKKEVIYEIHLERATTSGDPAPINTFAITKVIELRWSQNESNWVYPIITF